jgi:hypothetical protein
MEIKAEFRPNPELKLMDQLRKVLRYYHYVYIPEGLSGKYEINMLINQSQG